MSAIDDILTANKRFAETFQLGDLPRPPARRLAIVSCMDARLSVERSLGLNPGDAHILRNAGGIVTEDVLRSLILSHHLLGTQEFMVINHTDCGMLTFEDEDIKKQLEEKTHATADVPASFLPFRNLEENVRQQVEKIKAHPWLPKGVPVRGFIYDVRDGRLYEV